MKDDSFGTNLTTGTYKETGLATLYQQLKSAPPDKAWIADLAMYGKDWAMFIGAPVYDGNRQVGILVYRIPFTGINAIVQDRAGLSSTAETYVVGPVGNKFLYRSDRVVKQSKIGTEHAASKDIESALVGKAATDVKVGSTGVYEVSVGVPYQFLNLTWALITSQALAEGLSPIAPGQQKDHYRLLAERYGY